MRFFFCVFGPESDFLEKLLEIAILSRIQKSVTLERQLYGFYIVYDGDNHITSFIHFIHPPILLHSKHNSLTSL